MSTSKKTERFEIRWSAEQKRRFERASELAGHSTLAQFITSVVQRKAEQILEENERILASERDRERFFDALMQPPEPNEELREAARSYKKGKDD